MRKFITSLSIYGQRRMLVIAALGFSSGLPLALVLSTLTAWLYDAKVSIEAIGLFALVSSPYSFKFLWSPLVDGISLPLLCNMFGRRKGWLLGSQLVLMACIILLGFSNPQIDPWFTAIAALLVAFVSATQDIVIDAYRVEALSSQEQGAGAAASAFGYRVAMLVSSAGALLLAEAIGWEQAYICMALCICIGIIASLFAEEPSVPPLQEKKARERGAIFEWLKTYVIAPFADFMTRPHWLTILFFVVFYKFADAFIGQMTMPFLRELGFTKPEIARVMKLYGFVATVAGSLITGSLIYLFGVRRILFMGGLLHGATNLMFALQARAGHDLALLTLGVTLENVTAGIATTAFVAYLSSLCHKQFTATQYALLSSLAAFARTWLAAPAGQVAAILGWEQFFILSAFLALPGLLLLLLLKRSS